MSTKKITTTNSVKKTREIAAKFAEQILRSRLGGSQGSSMQSGQKPGNTAVVLGLRGELGSGKTTFLQGFAEGLGIKEKILSPTFILMKRFKIYDLRFKNFYHIDCYRLKNEKDSRHLGFKEIVSNPENIVAIEWPERIRSLLPRNKILIKFDHINKTTRKLTIIE